MQTTLEMQTVDLDHRRPATTDSLAKVRAVFSFPVVLGALLILLTLFTIRARFNDPDIWWHLKTGQVIWNTHTIPRTDLFSFTAFGHPWTAQEWLSEWLMYAAYHLGGYTGLMLGFTLVASLLIIGGYVLCTLYSGNCKVAFVGGLMIWFFSTIGLAIRPQLIGYLLLVIELILIHLGRVRNPRWLLGLPPLFALWINLHSSFFFGLLVLCLILFFSFVNLHAGLLISTRWAVEKRKMIAVALPLSIVALFLNPNGLRQIWYPLDTIFNQKLAMTISQEWQQANITDFRTLALLLAAALVLIIPLLRQIPVRVEELALVTVGLVFALQHVRMLFVFGILAAPVLCRLLEVTWLRYDRARDSIWASAAILGLLGSVIVVSIPSYDSLQQQVEKSNPAKAIRFMRASGIKGRMLNEYIFGGYLIWAAPERKVFVDGRSDVFEWAGVLADYKKWLLLETNPNELLSKYRIDVCLLARDTPMARVTSMLPGWKQIYSDDLSVVFTRQ